MIDIPNPLKYNVLGGKFSTKNTIGRGVLLKGLPKIVIICGHYGVGKTNVSLNIAYKYKQMGERVYLVDLDVVNPYFVSSIYKSEIEEQGIRLISPQFANSNLDHPSLPAEINSIFSDDCERAIIDVGGDDAGSTALGTIAKAIKRYNYCFFYVINKYRVLTTEAEKAAELLPEIEKASRLQATGIINNSHLSNWTKADDIFAAMPFAQSVSELTKLPLSFTTVPEHIAKEAEGKIANMLPVSIHVKKPWES